MAAYRLIFINHACFRVEYGPIVLLCDPWLSGLVFNNSWTLAHEETDFLKYLDGVTHIWISHEHPDHLHFPTLRAIHKNRAAPIHALFRKQVNKNVVRALEQIGFAVTEIPPFVPFSLCQGVTIHSMPNGGDTAAVLEIEDCRIFNQNDCLMTWRIFRYLRSLGAIDFHLNQFSQAGYYARPDETTALALSRYLHLCRFLMYDTLLGARVIVPVASFIKFCRPLSEFMNSWRVSLRTLQRYYLHSKRFQVIYPGDELLQAGDQASSRNTVNLNRWEIRFAEPVKLYDSLKSDDALLFKAAQDRLRALSEWYPRWCLPPTVDIFLENSARLVTIDARRGKVCIGPQDACIRPTASMEDADLLFLLQQPWGADTVNISASLRIYRQLRWRLFVYLLYVSYSFKHRSPISRLLLAAGGACVHSCYHYLSPVSIVPTWLTLAMLKGAAIFRRA